MNLTASFIIGFIGAVLVMVGTIAGTIVLAAYTTIPQLWCVTIAIGGTASVAGLANAAWHRISADID